VTTGRRPTCNAAGIADGPDHGVAATVGLQGWSAMTPTGLPA
jgi:hypothetical protein